MDTSQPKSYNHTPMIVFAQFTPSGRAKANSWRARIPLRCDESATDNYLPICFKAAFISNNDVWFGKESFCPIKVDDFLPTPGGLSYLNSIMLDNVCKSIILGISKIYEHDTQTDLSRSLFPKDSEPSTVLERALSVMILFAVVLMVLDTEPDFKSDLAHG